MQYHRQDSILDLLTGEFPLESEHARECPDRRTRRYQVLAEQNLDVLIISNNQLKVR